MAKLVTVVIAARNRPDELATTLQALRQQTYEPLELVVIDDASDVDLRPIVEANWPEAYVLKNDHPVGLVVSKNRGFQIARGTYIISLDDDSCFVHPDDISCAVTRMESERSIGALAFRIHNGITPPDKFPPGLHEQYVSTYVGCGAMIRKEAFEQAGNYREMFVYYIEDPEHSLRLIGSGWSVLFFPDVLVHHRKSPIGRSDGRIWGFSARNEIWMLFLNLPVPALLYELPWKIFVHTIEALRRLEIRWALWAIVSAINGLPHVLAARNPIGWRTYRKYLAVRIRRIRTAEEYEKSALPSLRELATWLASTWWHRRRARPFWDKRMGGKGRSDAATYSEHA